MVKLNPSMRLAVNRDTFFLPNPDGSVYFRNNVGTFRMEGEMIDQWVQQLLPIFNGEHTLAEITADLPEAYQSQIYQIAESLLQNGFVQDVSDCKPHQLSAAVVERFSAQIGFVEQLAGSGGQAFQAYRQQKPLAVGAGSFLLALIHALWESGCPHVHFALTDRSSVNRERLAELYAHARQKDPEAELTEIPIQQQGKAGWEQALAPFSAVLYVADDAEQSELPLVHAVCREMGKTFVPAFGLLQKGVAGPLVHPSSPVCLDSVLRRLHRVYLREDARGHPFTATSAALLANVAVFEWFKQVTGVAAAEPGGKLYVLDLETLSGSWRTVMAHPLVQGSPRLVPVDEQQVLAEAEPQRHGLFASFQAWTSPDIGIFHLWDEGELVQLPLAQCQVQAVDPVADGPAELLPARICPGYTHEEARKEAGLLGTEMYVSRLVGACGIRTASAHMFGGGKPDSTQESVYGIGAGESGAEALCRALYNCLQSSLAEQVQLRPPVATRVKLPELRDEPCLFYLRAFAIEKEQPQIARGADLCGFPVYWVGIGNGTEWVGTVGLHEVAALRKALQAALLKRQGAADEVLASVVRTSFVSLDQPEQPEQEAMLRPCPDSEAELWQQARDVLARQRLVPVLLNAAVEPFLQEDLAGVVALSLREEEAHG
ncbi:putative thiazole-containing bacteriocin maturation protein [Brevibacillus agri]|uniref:Thiazole-containing bacteriocin maturation protein n=1 Tax=Brevibacillus agri TaxID=51101 RepID=A0A3M8ABU4_9BACL|nr:putative thiazole-containing bacteriocin maturation protein [Brevibacillus agri]QAV14073.1 putative thiazole-containing bacteriocin maturation protein [Brevibacillus agri]RNB48057.1 putative thiazole-containing bacteriocin maturation protein [Brevibacillus agri]GED24842.1 putative thiazole-containing bacteriocin maturation protein [Brevibacillus agri]